MNHLKPTKYKILLSLVLLYQIFNGYLFATPTCQIVTENFSTLADGTTADNRPTGWYIDASQVPDALYFAVKSRRFHAEELGGQGIWYSRVMSVTGKPNFQIGVKITAEGTLTGSEYVKIYYKLNGGNEILIDQRTGNFGTIDFQSALLNAGTVQIIIKLYNYDKGTSAKSVYYIEEYRIFSNVTGCSLGVDPVAGGTITCANPSVTLSPGTNTTSNVTYQWTGPDDFGSTLQNPGVTLSGTYNVTATIAASSSTATGSVTVVQNTTAPGATAGASGSLACSSPAVIITGNSGTADVTYKWSGPEDFTSNRSIDTIAVAGTYSLTVTDPSNGCTSTAMVNVAQGTPAPGASASVSGPLTCTTTSITLSGSSATSGVSYNWTGPDNFTSSSQNPTVSAAGIYTLTVTNPATSCISTAAVTVIQNGTLPGATATVSGPLTCTADSVTLLGSSPVTGVTYNWNGPGGFSSETQNPVVNATGDYSLTVTDPATGCQSGATIHVTQNTAVPGANASAGGVLNCTAISVTLSGSSDIPGVNYSWSGPIGFASTTQNPSVTNPGSYTLTVTNPVNGCTSKDSTIVTQSEAPPGGSAGVSGILTCTTASVILTGSSATSGVTYSWSGPGGFSSSSQSPSAGTSGNYILTVTNPSNSCTSTATVFVDQNTNPPGASAIVSGTLTCDASVTLLGSSATSGVTYSWTGPDGFISLLQNPTTNTSGTYTLTVTDPVNGCANSQVVTVDPMASASTDFWVEDLSLANGTMSDNGATGWSLQNTGSGTFSVQNNEFMASFSSANEGVWLSDVIDISGMSNVTVSAYLRSATASSSDYLESDDYIRVYYKLNGGAETLVFGNNGGLNGANNSTSSTTIASSPVNGNTLQVVIRVRNSHSTERYYFDNVVLAGTAISSGVDASASVSGELNCTNTSVMLMGSSSAPGVTYSWTGPGSYASFSQNPAITTPGSYILTVSNSAGCTASDIVNVIQNNTLPDITAGVGGNLSCTSASVTLTGGSATSGVTYQWSGPEGFSSSTQNPVVSAAGSYILTITDPSNGCTNNESVEVISTAGATSAVWLEDFTLSNGTTVDNGATSWFVTASPGTFSVNNNEFMVSGTGTSSEGVWTSGTIDISTGTNVTIVSDVRSSGVVMNTTGTYADYLRVYYKLDGGAEILVGEILGSVSSGTTVSAGPLNGSGLQVVVRARATGSDEFYHFDNVEITATTQLNAIATANGLLGCTVSSVTLTGTSNTTGVTYSWEGPNGFSSTLQSPVVADTGEYTLIVTDPASGCMAQDTAGVFKNITAPGATAGASGELNCVDSVVTLSGSSATPGVSYNWTGPGSFGSALQNPEVGDTGTYILTVTNPVNGCTSTASTIVEQDTVAPDVTATVSGTLTCTTTSVTLSGSSSVSGVDYNWSGPEGFSSMAQNPSVTASGTFVLTIADPDNGCTGTQSVVVVSNTGATGTIWLEEFPHANGTTTDNGITSWSAASSTGTFAVYNKAFRTTNSGTSSQGVWTSGTIDISGKTDVRVSADVRSSVTGSAVMNTSGTYRDYIRFYYKLNGGAEILFAERSGAINGHSIYGTTLSADLPAGTSLQIIAKVRATGSDEFYYFDNVKVIGNGQIDASASVSGSLTCTDTTVVLYGNSGVPGVTYNWSGPGSFSSSLQNPDVDTPGTYSLTVTDPSNGCYSTVNDEVTQDITPPGASAGVSGQLSCSVASVTLSGSSSTADAIYTWSGPAGFFSDEQNPQANTLGAYTLSVTDPTNGCTSISSVEVTAAPQGPPSIIWLEDFSLPNGTAVDNGSTGWSLQNTGTGTFSVQSNEFMASFGSANEGIWLSEVIDISSKSNVVVSVDLRSAPASSSDYLEQDDYISVYYKLDDGTETLIYEDFAGIGSSTNTTASATVASGYLNAGTLQVIIKARNSHSTERYYFDNVEITGTDQVVGTITTSVSGPVTCPDQNVQLSASVANPAATYYWTGPDNNTIDQQNPVVNKPGNYNVVVSVGGCQASKTVTVEGGTEIPDVSVSGDHLACSPVIGGIPAVLHAISSNADLNYSWTGPAGFTSTSQSPSVFNSGTYTVTVTDQSNLCINSAFFDVQFGTLLWNEGFDDLADGTIEDLGSTAWNIDNSLIHTVDLSDYSGESGVPYYFEVRNNKLEAKSTRGEVVWSSYPIDISGTGNVVARLDVSGEGSLNDSSDCGQDCYDYDYIKVFYKIDGGGEIPFENLGSIHGKTALSDIKVSGNIPGGNTLQIVLKVYNTGNNEIFWFDNIQVLALGQGGGPVTASASGSLTCSDSTVTLTASPNIAGNSYTWTGPVGFVSNEPVVDVDQAGTYTLMLEGNTGCVTSDTVSIEVQDDMVLPDLSVDSVANVTCLVTTVMLNASSVTPNTAFTWTGFGTGQNPVDVSVSGNYKVTATNNANGCTTTDSVIVVADTTVPELNIAPVSNLTCLSIAVSLNASSSAPNTTFTWDGFASGQNPVNATIAGNYVVTATNNDNGCTINDSVMVSQDITTPGADAATSGILTCSAYFITLSAASPAPSITYRWTGPGGYVSTQQNPVTSKPGEYTLTVTNPLNGCVSVDTIFVQQNNTLPENVTAAVQGILNCSQAFVTLVGSSATDGVIYEWSGPDGFSSAEQNPVVTNPGAYSLAVTDPSNGCSVSANVLVEQNVAHSLNATATVSGILTCVDTTVILTGSANSGSVTYSWLDPNGFTTHVTAPVVSIPGKYILTVNDIVTGCFDSASVVVEQNIMPPSGLTASVSDTLGCGVTSVILSASSATGGVTYLWTDQQDNIISDEQVAITSIPGNYRVMATDPSNGCISEEQVLVIEEECTEPQ
jgi:hypothetical protein